jgi:hypothetical protein
MGFDAAGVDVSVILDSTPMLMPSRRESTWLKKLMAALVGWKTSEWLAVNATTRDTIIALTLRIREPARKPETLICKPTL